MTNNTNHIPRDDATLNTILDELINDPSDGACSQLCDAIINDRFTLDTARYIECTAATYDPSYSKHAAHIRDAIRDSFDI